MDESSPLIQVLLACDIAGVGLDPSYATDADLPQRDFELESALSDSVTLQIAHDDDTDILTVSSIARLAPQDLQRGALLALSLNHPAPHSDRFSLDLASSSVMFARLLPAKQLDLADLAWTVRTATEVALALARVEFPEILVASGETSDSDVAESGVPMIRG